MLDPKQLLPQTHGLTWGQAGDFHKKQIDGNDVWFVFDDEGDDGLIAISCDVEMNPDEDLSPETRTKRFRAWTDFFGERLGKARFVGERGDPGYPPVDVEGIGGWFTPDGSRVNVELHYDSENPIAWVLTAIARPPKK